MKNPRRPSKRQDSKKNIGALLSQLENAQLLHSLTEADATYIFKHTLTQETAYRSVLARKRREIHRRVAETYEQLFPNRLDEIAALLEQHYADAGDDVKTLEYATRAGDAAARMYANAEAVMHYRRALDLAAQKKSNGEELIHLFTSLGRVLEMSGRYQEAEANYDDMERVGKERKDGALELAALVSRATIYAAPTSRFDPTKGQALSEKALATAREFGDRKTEAKILWNLMLLNGMSGRQQQTIECGEQALAIARAANLREQLAFILTDIYRAYVVDGMIQRGLAALDEARQIWQELGNLPMLADSLSASAMLYHYAGEYENALAKSQEALSISESIGNLWGQSFSRMVVGYIHLDRGDAKQAIEIMQAAIRFGQEAGFIVTDIWTRGDLAWTYAMLGDFERGIEHAQLALEKAQAQYPAWRPTALAMLTRVCVLSGDLARAQESIQNAISLRSDQSFIWVGEIMLPLATAELAFAKQDFQRVLEVMDQLIDHIDRIGFRIFLSDALVLKGLALLSQRRLDEASYTLEQARSEAEWLGSRRKLWQIFGAFSHIESERGNLEDARRFRDMSCEIVEYIAEHIGSEDLRTSFLDLPAVRQVMSGETRKA